MNGGEFNWDIARAVQAACILEADAPKVGNINRDHDFSDCTLECLHLSALAIMQPFGNIRVQGVGRTIFKAVSATRELVSTNTNLGIILLLAPLGMAVSKIAPRIGGACKSYDRASLLGLWKREIGAVIAELTVEDTDFVYKAIRLASPSGMGHVPEHDLYSDGSPEITLLEAMKLAADRDMVAKQYVNNFRQVLDEGYQALVLSLDSGLPLPQAIAQTHLLLLSLYGDSLIARKLGTEFSAKARQKAGLAWENGGFLTPAGRRDVRELDRWLREDGHKRNPGTTADLITAIIFVLQLEIGLGARETPLF